MACYGTKSADWSPRDWKPETLGELYQDVIRRVELVHLNKPVPGDHYRKRYKSLQQTDLRFFRDKPEGIIITQPARLFRTMCWNYQGITHFASDPSWKFEYKYFYAGEWHYRWMPVRLLSFCYVNSTITYQQKSQLSLF